MADCFQAQTVDIVLGVVLGRIVVMLIEALWTGHLERREAMRRIGAAGRHPDGSAADGNMEP